MDTEIPGTKQATVRHHIHALFFMGIVALVYAAALSLAGRLPHLESAGAIAAGLTLDLVVVVPLAFYLLIIRRYDLSVVSLVPVLILSVLAAGAILPSAHQQPLRALEILVGLMEVSLIGWIGWRASRALRKARRQGSADPLEQFRIAGMELLHNDRVAGVFATEMAVFYYALGSWRSRPHAPSGTSPFTHHRRSGQAAMVFALLLLMLVEGIAVHILLSLWSPVAAWIFTAGTIYGALWLFADYRATVLRPILVDDEHLTLRAGLRWTLQIPRTQIAEMAGSQPTSVGESLNLTFLASPTHWVVFHNPVPAQGPYGFKRMVKAVGIRPDTPHDLERIIASHSD
jgi:hypothetical protein